jgi:hypothetical protein
MKFRNAVAAFVLTASTLSGAGLAMSAESASAVSAVACTKTSSGTCIKGGQFCPKAKKKKAGYDAKGRRYVCKSSKGTLHWMK